MSGADLFWGGLIQALILWFAISPEQMWTESNEDLSTIGLIEQG